MKRIRKAALWLLCLVMFASAVACVGEKGASGQNVTALDVHQGKAVVTDGKHRGKPVPAGKVTSDEVVVENNYLSNKQKTQKEKEFDACKESTACKLQVGSKWDAIDIGQQTSYGAGMLVGVPAGLVDSVQSIVDMGLSPVETYDALKSLFDSGDVLGNVSDAVKQSYITRLNNMEAEYQKAGASGSFNAGVEGGKLISEIASLAAGGAGIAKGGAVLTEKVVVKAVGKAESTVVNAGKAASGAENAANASKLNSQLSAQEIANGHAFEKHVLQRGEFDGLGIKTRTQFEQHVENVINNPTDVRYYSDGRIAYLDSTTRTVVIRNPGKGESTAFRPDYDIGWDNYIKRLPTQNTPPMN